MAADGSAGWSLVAMSGGQIVLVTECPLRERVEYEVLLWRPIATIHAAPGVRSRVCKIDRQLANMWWPRNGLPAWACAGEATR